MCFKQNITQVAASIVDMLTDPLSVVFDDVASHFRQNGSNFLNYHLLNSFQSLGTMLVYLGFEVASEKKVAGCQIW